MNFLTRLWARWGTISAPALPPELQTLALTPSTKPTESREAVSDVDGERARAFVYDRRVAMGRLCRHANSFVERDYGQGPVVLRNASIRPNTPEESTLLEAMDVKFRE